MNHSIDYYAFTIPTRSPFASGDVSHETVQYAINAFISGMQITAEAFSAFGSWSIEGAKHPYQTRLRHILTDVCLSIGSVNPHVYVELAGKACNNFDAIDQLDTLIRTTCERASRIDFAVDIKTDTDPRDFANARSNQSFKSTGEIRKPSGRTSYVGGRSSERMARVYRYEPPHPRAEYLRVEAEYKGNAAKIASKHYLEAGLLQASMDAHTPFGWSHTDWSQENTTSRKINYTSYRPENAATIRWLYGDVITALSKACKSELVILDDWLTELKKKI